MTSAKEMSAAPYRPEPWSAIFQENEDEIELPLLRIPIQHHFLWFVGFSSFFPHFF
jgi:hypothetical protein